MIKIIFYTYIFVRWTGGWGAHTGLGAWMFFVIWTVFMLFSVMMAAAGPVLTVVSIANLLGCDSRNIAMWFRRTLMQPAGRALIMGHWGSMSLTALVCYIAYYFTGNINAAIANPSSAHFIEWILGAWYFYQVYSFKKNGAIFKHVMSA